MKAQDMNTPENRAVAGHIRREMSDGIAWLTVCNPARYNAMSLSMWRQLAEQVKEADADAEIRVLVLKGEGEKAFVSGADISEFGSLRDTPEAVAAYGVAVQNAQEGLSSCSKPVIAAIRGICMGGGIGLALACDLRYCTDDARFRMPAARMGLGYDLDGIRRAVTVMGLAQASEIFMTAKDFNGLEAQRMGMVQSSFPRDAFDDAVLEVASRVAGNAPLTLKAAKLAFRHVTGDTGVADADMVHRAVQACFDSTDYREGQAAFQQKRPPRFTGQ